MGNSGSKNRLTKADIDFLKEHTAYDEITIKQLYKTFMQDCPSGHITPEKFATLYATVFASRDTKDFSTYVFKALDTDGNGYIDFREFMLATTIGRTNNPQERLKWAFKIYDADGNGYIDKMEMIRILKAIFQMSGKGSEKETEDSAKSAEKQALTIFLKLDKNKDGKVSSDEFVQGCLEDEMLITMLSK